MAQERPTQPPKPDYSAVYTSPHYDVRHAGQCSEGSFIRSYVPLNPYRDADGRLKVVVFLHGFCMGAAEIYHSHLVHLVQQGYYVFFPTYHHGFCRFQSLLPMTLLELSQGLFRPFPLSPRGWLRGAITSVSAAFEYAGLKTESVDTYVYGHSLGGLFALSWPAYAGNMVPGSLLPRQVLAADPIPDSESLIPTLVRLTGERIGAFYDRVDVIDTGSVLKVPVAILHGASDTLVPAKRAWTRPFSAIASTEKRFYCSQSDNHGIPALVADHVQSAIDTSFLPDWMAMMSVGGVASENNLDWRYIWSALDQVIRGGARADRLEFDMGAWSDGTPIKPILSGTPGDF